jgi:hypothetical protein
VGIELATGQCQAGVLGNEVVHEHPDTGEPFGDLIIPQWQDFLNLAARCYDLTGLGYLGVDIVLDRDHGPLILELNARPGLNIQIACGVGLKRRLDVIETRDENCRPEDKVQIARELFR